MGNPTAPDASAVVIAYLNGHLTGGVQAYGDVPKDRPGTFVRVILAGGAGRSQRVIYRALVIVEAWAETKAAASALARQSDALMFDMADQGHVYLTRPAGAIAYLPDPTSRQHRYTATYEVTTRAV